jgi:hypothetical protein
MSSFFIALFSLPQNSLAGVRSCWGGLISSFSWECCSENSRFLLHSELGALEVTCHLWS